MSIEDEQANFQREGKPGEIFGEYLYLPCCCFPAFHAPFLDKTAYPIAGNRE